MKRPSHVKSPIFDPKSLWLCTSIVYDRHSCWLWKGKTREPLPGYIYGVASLNGETGMAHHFIMEYLFGKRKNSGRIVRRCRVTQCVRPSHLYFEGDSNKHTDPLPADIKKLFCRNRALDKSEVHIINLLLEHGLDFAQIASHYVVTAETILMFLEHSRNRRGEKQ